jgi:acyl-CoA carboxylase epsilon subunit
MGEPVVRVLRGAPDETELAALVAVLAAVGAPKPAEPEVRMPARPRQRPRYQPATSWRTCR